MKRRYKHKTYPIVWITGEYRTTSLNPDISHITFMQLRDNQKCFVCGTRNPAGLSVDFKIDRAEKSIHATFVPSDVHQSFEGIVHGGIISALLDEAMGKLAFNLGTPAVTAEMTVRFKAPAEPGEELFISGRIVQATKRLIRAEARIQRGPVVIAEAEGKLLRAGS